MENDEQSIFYAYGRPLSMIETAADSETGSSGVLLSTSLVLTNLTCAGGHRCAWKYSPSLLISIINCSNLGYYISHFTSNILISGQFKAHVIT